MKKHLLILSGWAIQPSAWKPLFDLLEQDYELSLVDWNDVDTLDGFNQKATRVIQKKGMDRFSVIGWSLGSLSAINIAAGNLFGIENIVLISGTGKFTQENSESYNCGWDEKIVNKMICSLEKNINHTLSSFYKKMFSQSEIKKGYHDCFLNEVVPLTEFDSVRSLVLGLEYLIKSDFREKINCIDIPALLIHGCDDLICPVIASVYIHSHLKKSELIVFKETGHMPFYTNPQRCYEAINSFLNIGMGEVL
ncbi:pimeloyl-[acyl-carrier protein] methyl ester esterase [Peptoclostridium litorale DSM 5388]|uniref:Pimeloyl-[acyl-carrier protein] methyl ester esterase BioH n=1 Tax=Peptoclostridium litorale DSM 5388 TaxID=1121324 RepID=A0A069RKJ9_PEPLI|nr:alpha/beta hydrolase [Peptoclostridium litorale]KDR96635.1 pimeloyl-[acyl-carrier protein] methyl ester esterase BioH [Peptoclostridium litorale DSM 5388]SIN68226.1 pimeloyl-[acyl-carrier protein] methyl ester esterase [Peptoclostridium litorale DSM 5388]